MGQNMKTYIVCNRMWALIKDYVNFGQESISDTFEINHEDFDTICHIADKSGCNSRRVVEAWQKSEKVNKRILITKNNLFIEEPYRFFYGDSYYIVIININKDFIFFWISDRIQEVALQFVKIKKTNIKIKKPLMLNVNHINYADFILQR